VCGGSNRYLSPAALRVQLEDLVSERGEAVLCQEELITSAPAVYWNLVWYCARSGLPLPVPSKHRRRGHSYSERVLIGWDGPGIVSQAQVWSRVGGSCLHGCHVVSHLNVVCCVHSGWCNDGTLGL